MTPDVVMSERLRLPLWTRDEADDIRAGRTREGWHRDYPRPDDRDAATMYQPGDPWGLVMARPLATRSGG